MTPLATIRAVDGYHGLQKAFRARWLALGISGDEVDRTAFLAERHAVKLLAEFPSKNLGPTTLGAMMGALGLKLLVVEDRELAERITRHTARHANATAGVLPKKRRKRRGYWKGDKNWSVLMNAHRALKLSDRQRSIIARKAARARWRKHRMRKAFEETSNRRISSANHGDET